MSITVTGLDDLQNLFLQIQSEAPRRAVAEMIKGANKIQALAREMAPVDEGSLEESIKVHLTSNRDARGRFAKQIATVEVDMDMPAGHGKTTVGAYAYEVHEHMTPYGPRGLGPRSTAKQNTSSVIVGGGFLERAAEAVSDEINKDVTAAVKAYL